MNSKNLVFLINLHHPYIKFTKDEFSQYAEEGTLFFHAINDCYLPLLKMISNFEQEKIPAKFSLVFSASVCALLDDEDIKKKYNEWLDNLIEFGQKEVERTKDDFQKNALAKQNLFATKEKKHAFNELYNADLLGAFSAFAKKGFIEILATCGTYLFMPHFCDMTEILCAQVESGLYAIKHYFGCNADGFFLPEMGYAPWIEDVLKSYGVEYTVLPKQSFLFSKIVPKNGIFFPARFLNSLEVFCAENFKFEKSGIYKNVQSDLTWELSQNQLFPFVSQGHSRHSSGFSYKNNDGAIYDSEAAQKKARAFAHDFFASQKDVLCKAQEFLKEKKVSLCFYIDGISTIRSHAEFFYFLQEIVYAALNDGVNVLTHRDLIEEKLQLQKILPYPATYSEFSYGENLLSNANNWMMRYLRKASERVVDLVSRFPHSSGFQSWLLDLGAKELMLAQDCSLFKMVHSKIFAEFASEYFKRAIVAFSNVYDALGTSSGNTQWFLDLEKRHPIIPWMNYRIFTKKL